MKWLILLLLSSCANPQLTVGVVDTGLDLNDPRFSKHLCPTGHADLTGRGLVDTEGHGTHVAGLIQKYAGNGNYCLRIFKYYDYAATGTENAHNEVLAITKALEEGTDIINISGGGSEYDPQEAALIHTHPTVLFVVAAGNEGQNIDTYGNEFYPASYGFNNIMVVGNLDLDGRRRPSSNYGSNVVIWEIGTNVLSLLPNGKKGYMTGTSMSTAVHTGKLTHQLTSTH